MCLRSFHSVSFLVIFWICRKYGRYLLAFYPQIMSKVFVYSGLKFFKAWLFLYPDCKILTILKNILCLEGKWDLVITVAKWKQDLIWNSKSHLTGNSKHISWKFHLLKVFYLKTEKKKELPDSLDYLDVCAKYYFYFSENIHYLKENVTT